MIHLQSQATSNGGPTASLQFLSQLSQNLNSQHKQQSENLNYRYGSEYTTDNYKASLKSFMSK